RLFADLELAHGDGRFTRLFRTLVKADLLILDDWGPDRLTANQRRDLMEIVEDRYGRGSTLITSQLPLDKWHDVIGEPSFSWCLLFRSPDRWSFFELGYFLHREIDLPRLTLGDLMALQKAVCKIIKNDLWRDADGT